ncbi:helix-turn-helix transcriptional regulator [Myxococcus stipitatus]|uniref:helix-turn-helix transcriptional regulator n=1 Tax=Myxococcus stipitatus TaxID=83455 RepID=UPI0031456FD2
MVTRSRLELELLGSIRDLSKAALPLGRLLTELNALLREPLGYAGSCWHGTDPATGFVTSTIVENLNPRGFERAAYLEMWAPEPLTFTRLRASGHRAATLIQAARGRPEDSARFRELLEPEGFGDELRINFDLPSGCWGSAVFMRATDRGAFTTREVGLATRLAPHISQLLCRAYPSDLSAGQPPLPPGVAVLDPNGRLVSVDPRGEAVLDELAETGAASSGVPSGLIAVAEHARGLAAAGTPGLPSRSRVCTRRGRWLTLHATLLEGTPSGQVAIIAATATPSEILPMALMSMGLSPREQDVALLVLRGHDTATISRTLYITPATVQDHLKSIFTKSGVRSRREFTARIIGPLVNAALPPPG